MTHVPHDENRSDPKTNLLSDTSGIGLECKGVMGMPSLVRENLTEDLSFYEGDSIVSDREPIKHANLDKKRADAPR